MDRHQIEINIIGKSLIKADELGLLKEVQEILKPFFINDESIDLDTICKLESMLNFEIINVDPTDKQIRREKLINLKIASGELITIKKQLKVDDNGLATIEDVMKTTNK